MQVRAEGPSFCFANAANHGKEVREALAALDLIDDSLEGMWQGRSSGGGMLSAGALARSTPKNIQALYQQGMEEYARTRLLSGAGPLMERMTKIIDDAQRTRQIREQYAEGFAAYDAEQGKNQIIQAEDGAGKTEVEAGKQLLEIEKKKLYNEIADRKQFDSFQTILSADEFPSSFEEFQNIKYTDRERYVAIEEKVKLYKIAERTGTIPNADVAITPSAKFEKYLLDTTHPRGKDKAYVIGKVLGYSDKNWRAFTDKLLTEIQKSPITERLYTEHGVKYVIPVIIWGERGRYLRLSTIWQIDEGTSTPRFITAKFPKKKER